MEGGRLFGLDFQLLHDAVLLAIAIFFLFLILSYLLFNPARQLLEDRKKRIATEIASAKTENEDAAKLKAEYEKKLAEAEKETEGILAEARKKALANEQDIVNRAKEEAARIIDHAKEEAALEQKRVEDETRQQMVQIAALMAQKVVSAKMDTTIQESLVEETIKEMGQATWQS